MFNKLRLPILILILILATMLLPGCRKEAEISGLKLTEVGPFSVKLQWQTDRPVLSTVFYGEGTLLDREAEEKAETTTHKIMLTGLKPATRFSYRIGLAGKVHTFRSAPGSDGSFDLVVLDENTDACKGAAGKLDTPPDIVVLYGPCKGTLGSSPESILTIDMTGGKTKKMEVGNALLTLYEKAPSSIVPEAESTRHQIVVLPKMIDMPADAPARLVLVSPHEAGAFEKSIKWDAGQTALLEIDTYEVAWAQGGASDRVRQVIVEAPPETKKTCLYCDRLMESGRYEESLAWYKDFIERESKMYQLEDAYFAIARILDEKLFRYSDALSAYEEFLEYFPKSRRKVLAKYRMDYILSHDDNNFAPLAEFEKAKAKLVRADPIPAVEKVEALVEKYPGSAVSAEALYWMGNLLQESHPDRARKHFRTLIKQFPKQENALVAAIALGDILYREKQYGKSRNAYKEALSIAPESFQVSISEKLRKSIRNIRREQIRWGAMATFAFWVLLSFYLKLKPTKTDLLASVLTLAAFCFAVGIYFAIAYEKAIPYLAPVAWLGALTALILLWNRALSHRIERFNGPIVMIHALTCSASAVFLVLYTYHHVYLLGV